MNAASSLVLHFVDVLLDQTGQRTLHLHLLDVGSDQVKRRHQAHRRVTFRLLGQRKRKQAEEGAGEGGLLSQSRYKGGGQLRAENGLTIIAEHFKMPHYISVQIPVSRARPYITVLRTK